MPRDEFLYNSIGFHAWGMDSNTLLCGHTYSKYRTGSLGACKDRGVHGTARCVLIPYGLLHAPRNRFHILIPYPGNYPIQF